MSCTIGQILVHLDASSRSCARLEYARGLAQQHGASLAALYATTPSFSALPYCAEGGGVLAAQMREIDDERCRRAREAFDRIMKKPGVAATWDEFTAFPVIARFACQALFSDLLVLGQHEHSVHDAADVPADFVEWVMVTSGKPAIVLPLSAALRDPPGTIVIAWKTTPQAARAVSAALPLLRRAHQVHVVAWGEAEPAIGNGGNSSLSLASYLRAHAVNAAWHRHDEEPEQPGESLLSTVLELHADLLVMGCYGNSRARELVLGGVSRTVLQSMTLPVLMAH